MSHALRRAEGTVQTHCHTVPAGNIHPRQLCQDPDWAPVIKMPIPRGMAVLSSPKAPPQPVGSQRASWGVTVPPAREGLPDQPRLPLTLAKNLAQNRGSGPPAEGPGGGGLWPHFLQPRSTAVFPGVNTTLQSGLNHFNILCLGFLRCPMVNDPSPPKLISPTLCSLLAPSVSLWPLLSVDCHTECLKHLPSPRSSSLTVVVKNQVYLCVLSLYHNFRFVEGKEHTLSLAGDSPGSGTMPVVG